MSRAVIPVATVPLRHPETGTTLSEIFTDWDGRCMSREPAPAYFPIQARLLADPSEQAEVLVSTIKTW